MTLVNSVFLAIIGLAGGVVVGSGFVAFITVLDIIPRLTVITKTFRFISFYEYAIVLGVLLFTWIDFRELIGYMSDWFLIPLGLFFGIFIGMLAAALTEVINVIPILAKRLNMEKHIIYILMAMAFGKIAGSLFQWLFFSI
jgi:stage V sporulation protein AB